MFEALFGLIKILPELLKLINGVMTWLNKVSGGDPKEFLLKSHAVFETLNKANTPEERQDAAKRLAELIHSLPK